METFKLSEFKKAGIEFTPVQENHSKLRKNVLRGLHYQLELFAQAKLVRCIRGSIFDVAVDIRKSSSTFGKWVSANISSDNKRAIFVPRGFAHGFVALEDNTEVIYLVDNEYSKEHERGIIGNDTALGINWPVNEPLLSKKDSMWPTLYEAELF